jgi:hypothetical protein
MFAKLKQYHRKQGDCLVPRHYKEDPSLGFWVNTLRNRRDELHSERIARLDSIGFVWDSHDHQWEGMFAKLAEYHQCHGDCLVPTNYKEDPSLGMWVSTQRKKRHELDPTRRESKAPVDRIRVAGQTWTTSVGREKQKKRTQS